MDKPELKRDGEGRVSQVQTNQEIRGPLGIWPFPILNALVGESRSKVEITNINRDERGNITSIEEIRL